MMLEWGWVKAPQEVSNFPLANLKNEAKSNCKLPSDVPLFALGNFEFEIYAPENCPLCASGSQAIKPGSRGN